MGSVGNNKSSEVYKNAVDAITKANGQIPLLVVGDDEEINKAVFRAIADAGVLPRGGEALLDKVQTDDSFGKLQLYYQGARLTIEGDDDKVILGKKKFLVNSYLNQLD